MLKAIFGHFLFMVVKLAAGSVRAPGGLFWGFFFFY